MTSAGLELLNADLELIRTHAQRGLEAITARRSPRSELAAIRDEAQRGIGAPPPAGDELPARIAELELEAIRMRERAGELVEELRGARASATARARLCDAERVLEVASLQLRGARTAALNPRRR